MANLKFTSTDSTTVTLSGNGLPNNFTANGSAYTLGTAISLSDGQTVEFAGSTNDFSINGSKYYQFVIGGDGTVTVEGDLISLINNDPYVKQYQFVNLFKGCTKITSIAGLNFPASIADWCYANMFTDCTGLVNAGTTLPAKYTGIWCYEGMFAGCTSMTTPPIILSERLAPFCYYAMFQGCSSLTDGPQLNNRTVEGEYSTNIMFKDCTNLSTIQVSFTDWPSGASTNESRKWLNNVSPNGVFVYPNTLPVSAIEATSAVPAGWTLSSTYPSQINVSDQSFEFDAMSNTYQYKSFTYSYNGEDTLNISVDTSNKPSWLLYQVLSNNTVYFTAQGYQINTSATVQIPIKFSAADAAPVTAYATFAIENYPVNQITVNTIPTFSFDAESQTDIVSSLLDYVTYGGSTLSCTVQGNLPDGLSCVDGIITGVPADFTGNYSGSFDIIYSASDARNVSSSFDLEIINAAPVYSTMPLTFKSTGATTITFNKTGVSNYPVSGSKDGVNWSDVTTTNQWTLYDGEFLYLTGNCQEAYNYDISHGVSMRSSGKGTLELYGNIMSLANWRTDFVASSQFGQLFNGCSRLVDASKLYLPVMTLSGNCYRSMFYSCNNLKYGPLLPATALVNTSNATGYDYMFYNNYNLLFVEVGLTSWGSYKPGNFMYGVSNSSGYFIKPQSLPLTRGSNAIPTNFKVLNRINGKLYYATSADGHSAGDEYTGEDPYAWYYGT